VADHSVLQPLDLLLNILIYIVFTIKCSRNL